MFQEFFRDSEWLHLPLIALVFFFVFFLAVLARVFFGMRDPHKLERLSAMPLGELHEPDSRTESTHG
ncbi:MAG: CcoQ/FixQ family Cbb3-type cytochrome c oxidase assembly chaperone [Planctomycetes bacterium]|nr:CcoQ/FixQ family Cbb3-type cytochrome c oxidase assembly chaperone [Planctomycetota bacterium]